MTTLAAAASGPPDFLEEVVGLLVAAAVIGYLSVRARVVPIVGFLLAGVVIGPDGLGVVESRETLDAAAEVGVILLLFSIGIEFSLGRLARIRRLVLVGGSVQVAAAVAVTTGVLVLAGVDVRPAIFTGFLVALSSTAIVLKLLGDRGETRSTSGQGALALLVFQDFAIIVMVLLLPVLGGGEGSPVELVAALGKAAVVIAATIVVARRVMPRLLEVVARACSPEVFLLTVIAICLGTAYLTALAGVSVSLGAFLAGLVVSESRHSSHALGEILPLQILFSAVFFLSVGTLLDVRLLLGEPLLVLAAVALVLAVKVTTTAVAARVVGLPAGTALGLGLLLAQVGEFSFVLERAGREQGLSPAGLGEDGAQAFVAATVLLMVATPALAAAGRALSARVAARAPAPAPDVRVAGTDGTGPPAADHVVVSGWGDGARSLLEELRAGGVRVTVVTLNPDGAREAEEVADAVVVGDSAKEHVLRQAGAAGARLVVVADDGPEHAARIAGVVSTVAPGATVVVRTTEDAPVTEMAAAGVDVLVTGERTSRTALWDAVRRALAEPQPGPTVVDVHRVVEFHADPGAACPHAGDTEPVLPNAPGCTECMRLGDSWVHLRICVACGHVGCCDSSPNRHAAAHARADEHPVMFSAEPGDDWGWCYLDEQLLPGARVG